MHSTTSRGSTPHLGAPMSMANSISPELDDDLQLQSQLRQLEDSGNRRQAASMIKMAERSQIAGGHNHHVNDVKYSEDMKNLARSVKAMENAKSKLETIDKAVQRKDDYNLYRLE